jgi:hypothetical protein
MSGHGSIDKLHNNTGLILRESTGRNGLKNYMYICDDSGNIKQLIPREPHEHPDEIRVWCLHGIALGEKVCCYFITVRMKAEGPMPVNFELVGSGLAVGNSKDWNFKRIPYGDTTIWWNSTLPQFGTTALHPRDEERVYLYGVIKDSAGIQQCYLARVRTDEIENLEQYEYLVSGEPKWGHDPREAVPVMQAMPNEMSVSWNPYLDSYLAVHSLDLTSNIVGRTAPHPWGPWSEPVVLWKVVPPKLDYTIPYEHMIYAGKEHPELSEENGRVLYLTYIEFEEYFPHLVEVELA